MKAKSYISYFKKWFWSLSFVSLVLLSLSLCVLLLKEESLRIEIVLSSIVLYSCMLLGTLPYFINNINNRSNLLSKISLIFYIFIIIFCILSIVLNGILIHQIKSKTEKKYESTVIVILSSLLFLLYLGNLIIETEMKISIQNMKNYTTEQGPWFQQTTNTMLVNDKKQPLYKKVTENSRSIFSNMKNYTTEQGPWFQQTTKTMLVNDKERPVYKKVTENSRSIFSNSKKYGRNDDQYQFLKTGESLYGEPTYIRIKRGESVRIQIKSGHMGKRIVVFI